MPTEKTKYTLENAIDDAFKLRRCIVQISEKSPSHARSVIDQFLRFIAPSMAKTGGADFPVTCRRHPRDAARCGSTVNGKYPTLYFHVGNAVLGFYHALATGESEFLHRRLKLLETIAVLGFDEFFVVGDESIGYTLMERSEALRGISNKEQAQAVAPPTA